MKSFFVLCVVVAFASLLVHRTECKTCNTAQGYHKFYSVVTDPAPRCGESCITDAMYPIYKIFEPGMMNATDNTPCADRNYTVYNGTETHGIPGILSVQLDLYCRNQVCS